MKTVAILEANDNIQANDWCRPLSLCSMSGGHSDGYSFTCQYSGKPENNVRWVRVRDQLGECWFGVTIDQFNKEFGNKYGRYEFVRGEIPTDHIHDYSKRVTRSSK